MELPDASDTVLVEFIVSRDDCEGVGLRLRDEHSVEWVAVGAWEGTCACGVVYGDR